ncbi:hypothetical protein FTUN_1463 [Frigoriglobus tundricola]|uniref:Uncharacterized protein n=1 Tax=Frigoriglobus tundricola TaxID=2774151 RepID=A0A6M5YIZ5_9BACT|nr:hypothetical protein FTUN_1463 [Frigoriglobus tundricola]
MNETEMVPARSRSRSRSARDTRRILKRETVNNRPERSTV